MKTKRFLALLLSVMMVLGMMPMTVFTVSAAEEVEVEEYPKEMKRDFNITLGGSHLVGGQVSSIYFGRYQQSSNEEGGYNVDPIKWRVFYNDGNTLLLLSDQNLDAVRYHPVYEPLKEPVTWETSTIRSWMNRYGASSNKQ